MLAVRKRVLGAEHGTTLISFDNLVCLLSYQGKHAEK